MGRRLHQFGVSTAVKEADIRDLSDAAQDRFIAEAADHLVGELKAYVGGTRPRSEFKFWVTGPHDDPLLGRYHAHHLAAAFDVDELPGDCKAYATYTRPEADREAITVQAVTPPGDAPPPAVEPVWGEDLNR